MTYYHLPTDVEREPGRVEIKLSDGAKLSPPETGWTAALAALVGFTVVVNNARPADTATHTTDRTLVRNGSVVTETWVSRPKTSVELAADTQNDNKNTIRTRLATARTANNNYLALAAPTNPQAVSYLDTVAKELNGLIDLIEAHWYGNPAALDDITDSA